KYERTPVASFAFFVQRFLEQRLQGVGVDLSPKRAMEAVAKSRVVTLKPAGQPVRRRVTGACADARKALNAQSLLCLGPPRSLPPLEASESRSCVIFVSQSFRRQIRRELCCAPGLAGWRGRNGSRSARRIERDDRPTGEDRQEVKVSIEEMCAGDGRLEQELGRQRQEADWIEIEEFSHVLVERRGGGTSDESRSSGGVGWGVVLVVV